MAQLGPDLPKRRSPELAALLEARAKQGVARALSDARIRRVHATLMSGLSSAVRRKYLTHNPARHIELASGRRPQAVVWSDERVDAWRSTGWKPPVAVWTAEQVGAFLDAASGDRLYPIFHLIAYRGLRRGEAVGLRWEDLHLDAKYLRVAQQIVQLGWATEIDTPKTASGARTVSLDERTIAVLRSWRATQDLEAAAWGDAWSRTGLVFTREDGNALHPDLVTDGFQRVYRKAKLPPIRLHDLRHTAASLALQAGVPMKVVSEQLGHSSLAITADTYTSVVPAVAQAAAEAVANLVPRSRTADAVTPSFPIEPERGSDEVLEGRKTAGQEGWAPWGSNPQPAD
jgi:integrase